MKPATTTSRRTALGLLGRGAALLALPACARSPSAAPGAPGPAAPGAPEPRVAAATAAPAVHIRRAPGAIVRGTLLGPGKIKTRSGETHNLLARIDLDSTTPTAAPFPLPFYGHGLAIDPRDAGRALVFEKHGPGCCLVDLRAGRTLAMVKAQAGRQFYGHGVFNRDGAYLFCTETYTEDGSMRGVIAVRDSNTLAWVADMPSYGAAPHDLVLTPDGRTLVVTNGGGSLASGHVPSVAWIDLHSRKLLRRMPFSSAQINAGHVAIAENGDAAVVSAPRDGLDMSRPEVHGAISFWRGDTGKNAQMQAAQGDIMRQMRAETLSVAVHEPTGVVVATSPKGNLVSFWDLKTGTMMGSTTAYKEPRGVAISLDQKVLALSYGDQAELALLDPWTWKPLADIAMVDSFTSGAHLVFYKLDDTRRSGVRAIEKS